MSHGRNTTTRNKHRKLIAAGQPPCHWCHQPINYQAHHHDPTAFQIDHVIPLNRGGTDTLDNIVPAHRTCNRTKSDKIIHTPGTTYTTTRHWNNPGGTGPNHTRRPLTA